MTRLVTAFSMAAALTACGRKVDDKTKEEQPTTRGEDAPRPRLVGVDLDKKVVRLGALNDESGPAKMIGTDYEKGLTQLKTVAESTPMSSDPADAGGAAAAGHSGK